MELASALRARCLRAIGFAHARAWRAIFEPHHRVDHKVVDIEATFESLKVAVTLITTRGSLAQRGSFFINSPFLCMVRCPPTLVRKKNKTPGKKAFRDLALRGARGR